MGTVACGYLYILGGIELGVKGIVHAGVAAADLHMAQTGDLTHQRLQLGSDQLHSLVLIISFLDGIDDDMLDHDVPP